jgi:hypothetical protein
MGVPMGGSSIRLGHVAGVVLLSLFLISTCFSQVQKGESHNASDFQLPDAPSALRVSDSTNYFHLFEKTSSSHFARDDGRTPFWLSSSWRHIPDRRTPNRRGLPYESTRMVALGAHALSPRAGWLTFAPIHAQPTTVHSADDWQYYAHRIPVAGPVVRRVGQQAQAHPRVVMVFKVIQPQF